MEDYSTDAQRLLEDLKEEAKAAKSRRLKNRYKKAIEWVEGVIAGKVDP